MADTYCCNCWILLSSQPDLNLTLRFFQIPQGGESGTYRGALHTWVAVPWAYTVRQIVSGMYNWCLSRSKYLWLVASSVVYWCTLLLANVYLDSDSKYVPKYWLTMSNDIVSNHLLLCWPGTDTFWDLAVLMCLASDIIHCYHCLNSCIQYSSGPIH